MAPFVGPSRFGLSPLEQALGGVYTKANLQVDLNAEGDRVLSEIEALEVEKARLEAELLDAYAALHTIETEQVTAASVHVPVNRIVTEEIALATGVGTGEVSRRLGLATAPRRHRLVREALRDGELSLHRALQVASETSLLSDADVAAVEEAVLAPSRDGQPLSQRTFVTRLRRAIASADHRSGGERRRHARARRGVFGRLTDDGMGCLSLVASGEVVAAILDRLDREARSRRAAGDARSLDQLRCDLAAEALLRGGFGGSTSSPASGDTAGTVWLIVPFEVATGASNAACELPGHGWVTAEHAREIMTRPGSVWHALPVDMRTGRALSRPTASYRPTRAMVEHVRAVDGRCRGPGCEVIATRCDLDHEVPWPHGPTDVGNLHAKDRLHHNLKTAGIWASAAVDDDGLEWTTVAGRRYVTYPKDWRASLGDTQPRSPSCEPAPPPF